MSYVTAGDKIKRLGCAKVVRTHRDFKVALQCHACGPMTKSVVKTDSWMTAFRGKCRVATNFDHCTTNL